MRCLDINGAHPENDAVILVGILAGNTFDFSKSFFETYFCCKSCTIFVISVIYITIFFTFIEIISNEKYIL